MGQDRQREPRPRPSCLSAPPEILAPQPSYLVVPGTLGPHGLLLSPCCLLHLPLHLPLRPSSLAGRFLPPFPQGRLLSSLPPPAAHSGLQGAVPPSTSLLGSWGGKGLILVLLPMGGDHSGPQLPYEKEALPERCPGPCDPLRLAGPGGSTPFPPGSGLSPASLIKWIKSKHWKM